jgi:peptide/nickel transport system substrate-binding protein
MKEKTKQILNKKWGVEFSKNLSQIIKNFSISEKIFFYSIVIIFIISGLTILQKINNSISIQVPTNGGIIKEGIIGSPRFVNPVLAISDVDHDLTYLVYSGLMKATSDNSLIPDLAESYSISEDGLIYSFILKDNIYFHDGKKVTTDDIEFTINKIQDSTIKSPKRAVFYDVRVEKVDEKHINFILKKPYSPFLINLTVGILPKHLWQNLNSEQFPLSQYNVEPIGSGPYKISKMETQKKNMLLVPTYYELIAFNQYALNRPFIDKIIIKFYLDEESLIDGYNKKEIESINSISPEKISDIKIQKDSTINTSALPRIFAIFFNQNQSEILSNKEVRKALDIAIDRENIVKEVLYGYGKAINYPIPVNILNKEIEPVATATEKAINILEKAGWSINASTSIMEKKINKISVPLKIVISTLNSPDLVKTAELVKNDWQKIGVEVEINQFDFGDLQQNIIRPRKFDALLYGEVIGRDMDLYAFWHSSQRNDPGLNIAMYTNATADKLLEEARKTNDINERIDKYNKFSEELSNDIPAVFLYSPDFIYINKNKIKNLSLGNLTLPFERFLNVNNWYIETNTLWKMFIKQ